MEGAWRCIWLPVQPTAADGDTHESNAPPPDDSAQGLASKRLEANTNNIEAKLGSNALNGVGLFQALMQKQKTITQTGDGYEGM